MTYYIREWGGSLGRFLLGRPLNYFLDKNCETLI